MDSAEDFILANRDADVRSLALRYAGKVDFDLQYALRQIEGRQRAQQKLPLWAETEGIVFPPPLSLEQCSSQATAEYKSRLCEGSSFVDLTGGFGVDFSYMSRRFNSSTYVERNESLCEVARMNFARIGLRGYDVVCSSAEDFLRGMEPVDCIYMDPARRDKSGRKVISIADCEPDVLSMQESLPFKCGRLILKLSPMLDVFSAHRLLRGVSEVHAVSLFGECKELLFVVNYGEEQGVVDFVAANITADGEDLFCFSSEDERGATTCIADDVGAYLYEPNASIMKLGAFKSLASRWGMAMLSANSHLYTSDVLVEGFCGRAFRVLSVFSLSKSDLKQNLQGILYANVSVRNFPLSAQQLRDRLKLKDGGDIYIIGTTVGQNRHVLIKTEKVKK